MDEGATNASPPSRMRHVLVPVGVKVLALVGYARQLNCLSTMAELVAGNSKLSDSERLASPEADTSASSADMVLPYA